MGRDSDNRNGSRAAARAALGLGRVTARTVSATAQAGSRMSGAAARRALGGRRYQRAAEDVNGRLADALATLDAALRQRDAEIARLRAELAALRAQGPPAP